MKIQPLVVAGGHSRRFGATKALAPLAGSTFIDLTIDALELAVGHPPWIGVRNLADCHDLTAHLLARPATTFIEDHRDLCGPIASVAAALCQAGREKIDWVFVAGCDTPAIQPGLISALCQRACNAGDDVQAIVPRTRTQRGMMYQALHALYRPKALPAAASAPNLQAFVDSLHPVDVIDEIELGELDSNAAISIFNVNTREDLYHLERLLFAL